MTAQIGDLPDWSTLVKPAIISAAQYTIGPGALQQIFQSATPYRIWGVWLNIAFNTHSTYALGPGFWGAQINDGGGRALFRQQLGFTGANQFGAVSMALPIEGYTPIFSAGFYTTNLITDASLANADFRANAGILYSQP